MIAPDFAVAIINGIFKNRVGVVFVLRVRLDILVETFVFRVYFGGFFFLFSGFFLSFLFFFALFFELFVILRRRGQTDCQNCGENQNRKAEGDETLFESRCQHNSFS